MTRKKTTKPNRNFDFMIGADPEFNLMVQNGRLHAAKSFETLFGTSQPLVRGRGQLGVDGCASTAELRPDPSKCPSEVVDNIGKLLAKLAKRMPMATLKTTSEKAPVGGHVHLDLPQRNGEWVTATMGKALASLYIPLLMSENALNIAARRRANYGNILDFRTQNPGRARTLEFRAPTAEWLTSPKTAEATLAYLAVCWHEILYKPQSLKTMRDLIIGSKKDGEAISILSSSNFSGVVGDIGKRIRKSVRSFERYKDFEEECELALNPRAMKELKEKANYDIMVGWGFIKKGRPTKKDLLNQAETEKRMSKDGYGALRRLVDVPFNSDLGVEFFASALADRIVGYGWKTRNDYFLFGLKNGIPGPIAMTHNLDCVGGSEHIMTSEDARVLKNTFKTMTERHESIRGQVVGKEERARMVCVGLPHEARLKVQIRDFLAFVSDLEAGRLKEVKDRSMDALPKDAGIISKVYESKTEAIKTMASAILDPSYDNF